MRLEAHTHGLWLCQDGQPTNAVLEVSGVLVNGSGVPLGKLEWARQPDSTDGASRTVALGHVDRSQESALSVTSPLVVSATVGWGQGRSDGDSWPSRYGLGSATLVDSQSSVGSRGLLAA